MIRLLAFAKSAGIIQAERVLNTMITDLLMPYTLTI
jgi:hypothetical protein